VDALARHWVRIAVTLLPLVFALLHATGVLHIGVLQSLDDIIYDARLRATMPRTLDERIVIVDLDEKSLAEVGRWPWSRNRVAEMVDELFDHQQVAMLGFDVVFAEPDESSGLKRLRQLAQAEFKDQPAFATKLDQLQPLLDYDATLAKSLTNRAVVMGYYFTSGDREARASGRLPKPVMQKDALGGRPIQFTSWSGYGANIEPLALAAPAAGFFNPMVDGDGVVRAVPLLAEYKDQYYESLALAMFRGLNGAPTVEPAFAADSTSGGAYPSLDHVRLRLGERTRAVPVAQGVITLVPFRGPGGPAGGSYRYVSASDLLAKRVPAGSLSGKVVLVGTTAPGLQDLRVTPVGEAYAGVETHANLLSGLMDDRIPVRPDYALGYDLLVLLAAGLLLAIALPLLSAPRAVVLSLAVIAAAVALNLYLYIGHLLVLPLAAAVVMCVTAFALNMSYGYFVESRSKRDLAQLFGTYVPPELVDEMVKDPDNYTMKAVNKELTVMFCDMRGFTQLSEKMEPTELQQLLNDVFNRLTEIISRNRGTIDKYMGDCVMAFWGAPVAIANHAHMAVMTALEMSDAVRTINEEHRARGLPAIGIGIGVNTGTMCVGDMGSEHRRAYTVIGDAVNLGSRLEGLSKAYGVEIVASESTRKFAPEFAWQELDRVRVKGKEQAVAIYSPVAAAGRLVQPQVDELQTWHSFLHSYRQQDWSQGELLMRDLQRPSVKKFLYELYSQRVASMKSLPFDPHWDGATNFETK